MTLSISFESRDFAGALVLPPDVVVEPASMSDAAIGGPDRAGVVIAGPELTLWVLLPQLLRAPVVWRWHLEPCWYGYVADARIETPDYSYGLSLKDMANAIRVDYTPTSSTERRTTSWATDAASIALYGRKERKISDSGITDAAAESLRDRILPRASGPQPLNPAAGQAKEARLTLSCLGWWDTLGWETLSATTGKEEYTEIGVSYHAWGTVVTEIEMIAQSFQLADAEDWTALAVELMLAKYGEPTDELLLELCADSAGEPGAVLDSGTIEPVELSSFSSFSWKRIYLSNTVTLTPGGTYWLKLTRTGALSAGNHYRARGNAAKTYPRGEMLYRRSGVWNTSTGNDQDLVFRVLGSWSTTRQLATFGDAGQFIQAVTVSGTGAASTSPLRDGDTTIQAELLKLLEQGTDDGRRLLPRVNAARELVIAPEPQSSEIAYYALPGNRYEDAYGQQLSGYQLRAGRWVSFERVLPLAVLPSSITNGDRALLERVDVGANGVPRLTYRQPPSPYNVRIQL